jgi:hypothetical protein
MKVLIAATATSPRMVMYASAEVQRGVAPCDADDSECTRGSRRHECGQDEWLGSLQVSGRGQDVQRVGDRRAERQRDAKQVDSAQPANQHERGARSRRRERGGAAAAPAFAAKCDRAKRDERRIGEEEEIDETRVESHERLGKEPDMGAVPHAEQEPPHDLPPSGPAGSRYPHQRPEDRRGHEEPPGHHRADRRARAICELRQNAEPGEEDRRC